MKKYLFSILFVAYSLSLLAQSKFTVDGIRYSVITDPDESSSIGTVCVISNKTDNYSGDIVIPNAVQMDDTEYADRYKVVGVADEAFKNCEDVTSITFPSSLEYIGDRAFMECTNLKKIKFPIGNLNRIGELAFYHTAVDSVTIPGSVEFLDGTFYECRQLKYAVIKEGVVNTNSTFYGCENLETVKLPESLTVIGMFTFEACGLKELIIPKTVISIEQGAFRGNEKLESVVIPGSVNSISKTAFSSCKSLKQIKITNGVKRIKDHAFSFCTSLSSVTIPSSVEIIEDNAFYYCEELSDVIIEGSNTSIQSDAFAECPKVVITKK